MIKKYLPLLVLPVFFAACSTGESGHADPDVVEATSVRSGLLVEKSNPADLRDLDSMMLAKINIQGAGAVGALQQISNVYAVNSQGEGMKNLPLKMNESAIAKSQEGKVLSIEGNNISFRQLYEEICRQAGLVWWVDGAIYVEVGK